VVQSIYRRAVEWGRLTSNPAKAVRKPSGRRERAIRPLSPVAVEAVRGELPDGDATLVSLLAYAGLRCPEEALALEWEHVGERTILVEQRNIDGKIVPGQKVRGAGPRTVDLAPPLKQDLAAWRLRCGRPDDGALVFPRHDGKPWRRHDWNNWRRRVWAPAVERAGVAYAPPYDLRHAFASLQIRASVSVPELAEQLGHSPQMTLSTYTHVIRELKGAERLSLEDQIRRARDSREDVASRGAAVAPQG
jgi:integrase